MFEWFAKWFVFCVLRLLAWSYRFVILDQDQRAVAQKLHPLQSYILTFWHEHLLTPLFFFEGQKHCVLTSDSRDGKIIGFQCRKFGYSVVHGSQIRDAKDKGGLRALVSLFANLKQGIPIAITVDGSIGPRRYVKAGVIELARKSQAPILPIASAASRVWTLKTWDQFKIPRPFAKIVIQLGTPIMVPSDLSKAELPHFQQEVADALNAQEEKALQFLRHASNKAHGACCDHS